MDTACLDHVLTEAEQLQFEQDGYLIIENALSEEQVTNLTTAVDRVAAIYRPKFGLGPHDLVHVRDFVGQDPLFLELLTWYRTFPKVWGVLGWHIQLYLSHLNVTPPEDPEKERKETRLAWHQDSGRLNRDFETDPRPRVSVKIAYFLTDTHRDDCGNFFVIPGSHLMNTLDLPEDKVVEHPDAVPVCVEPGTAVIFDRRIWHSRSVNYAPFARKALFYGYSYRWLRPRDDHTVSHILDQCTPIQKQMFGITHFGGHSYTTPRDEDVPLKFWIEEHMGKEAVIA